MNANAPDNEGVTVAELIRHLQQFPQELKVYGPQCAEDGYLPKLLRIDTDASTLRANAITASLIAEHGLHRRCS